MSAAELRRLLELAAKAAGIYDQLGWSLDLPFWLGGPKRPEPPYWNPADDDSDSRRLEVKLRLQVTVGRIGCGVSGLSCPKDIHEEFQTGCDEMAVVRLAVLRAAAAIGEAMP